MCCYNEFANCYILNSGSYTCFTKFRMQMKFRDLIISVQYIYIAEIYLKVLFCALDSNKICKTSS